MISIDPVSCFAVIASMMIQIPTSTLLVIAQKIYGDIYATLFRCLPRTNVYIEVQVANLYTPSLPVMAISVIRLIIILSCSKRLDCFAEQDPGRARQSS